jgi:hypothetical protein
MPTYGKLGSALFEIRNGAIVPRPVLLAGQPCLLCQRKAAHAPTCAMAGK